MTTIDGDDDSYDQINKRLYKGWRNAAGQYHRDGDLPALILADGTVEYYRDGQYHRDGGLPAVIYSSGSVEYYRNDKLHRDGDLPAIIYTDGSVRYYKYGVFQKC